MVKLLIVLLVSIFITAVAGYFYLREKPSEQKKKIEVDKERFLPLKDIKELTDDEFMYLTRIVFADKGYYDQDLGEIIIHGVV